MRRSEGALFLAGVVAAALLAQACVAKLDHEFDPALPDSGDAGAPLVAKGCAPFGSLRGDLRSIDLDGARALWLADDGSAFAVSKPVSTDCAWTTMALGNVVAPSPLRADAIVAPLDLVAAPGGFALYYTLFVPDASAPLGLRALGVGVARRDSSTGRFVPTADLLWSADRPAYGGSALVVGADLFVYGCKGGGFLEDDCFIARAPSATLDSSAAYAYWTGARWSPSPDDAAPIAKGGGTVSVRRDPDPTRARFVMTYVPPLGSTVVARTSVAPEGPWSAPVTLVSCDLGSAGAGAFCSGAAQHETVSGVPRGSVAVTVAARTFALDAGAPSQNTGAFAAQVLVVPLSTLP